MRKDNLRSIRFCSRGRTGERGFVLVAALALAILYFALMELMLIDSTRALQEAQRFRARVIAAAMAESGAEMAAARMIELSGSTARANDGQGEMSGVYRRSGCCDFELLGNATTSGVPEASARVRVQGRINGTTVSIDYTTHSQ